MPPKRRGNRSGAIGTATESAVVHYLHSRGLNTVERRRLRGTADLGDLCGFPVGRVLVEIKGGAAAETASDTQIEDWLVTAELKAKAYDQDVVVLIVKRKSIGPGNAGRWWAINRTVLPCGTFTTRWFLSDWTTQYLAGCFDKVEDGNELRGAAGPDQVSQWSA